jgi:hypothetical protein
MTAEREKRARYEVLIAVNMLRNLMLSGCYIGNNISEEPAAFKV